MKVFYSTHTKSIQEKGDGALEIFKAVLKAGGYLAASNPIEEILNL